MWVVCFVVAGISEQLWQLYCRSILEVQVDSDVWCTLFDPDGGVTIPGVLAAELGRAPATIVTAWNPYSQPQPYHDNVEANLELAEVLDSYEAQTRRAIGRSKSTDYLELGLYVSNLSVVQVADIARRFHQHALYIVMASEILCATSDLRSSRSVRKVVPS
ncbi:MAG: DUF3293 domain-containing protein [Acidimicrobiales bacterium]